jgi:hypothetical protein
VHKSLKKGTKTFVSLAGGFYSPEDRKGILSNIQMHINYNSKSSIQETQLKDLQPNKNFKNFRITFN